MPARSSASVVGQRFGATVRRLRKERRLTQETLGARAGLTTVYVGLVERGENIPTLIAVFKIARALDVGAPELLAEFTRTTLRDMKL